MMCFIFTGWDTSIIVASCLVYQGKLCYYPSKVLDKLSVEVGKVKKYLNILE